MTIRGNAAFTWTDSDESITERVLLLAEPIREQRPAHRQNVYIAESLDFQTRQIFTIGTGVNEVACRVRFLDDGQGVLDLIKAGSKGRTITYHPTLDDPQQTHACRLIAPITPATIGLDPDTGTTHGYVDVELVVQLT